MSRWRDRNRLLGRPPLIEFLELACGAIAMGNAVVMIASEQCPLPAVEVYRVLETSDVPSGVFNIVTGVRKETVPTLAEHEDVDAIWCFASEIAADVERMSTSNLKQTWIAQGPNRSRPSFGMLRKSRTSGSLRGVALHPPPAVPYAYPGKGHRRQ